MAADTDVKPGEPEGAPRRDAEPSASWVERFVGGYELEGPRVRLGVLWFVAAVAAAAIGVAATAVVFGLVAGAAGSQAAAAWRRVGCRPNQAVAGLGALLLPVSAAFGIGVLGVAALVYVVAAIVAGFVDPSGRTSAVGKAGYTVRAGFFIGIAGASAVLLDRTSAAALVALIVLISGFEVGDYLVGTGASNPVEGPIAGIAASLVLTFAIASFAFDPFETGSAWVFGGLATVLTPLGSLVGSALVPSADARVPALRRLDSWLIVGPVWAFMLWTYLL